MEILKELSDSVKRGHDSLQSHVWNAVGHCHKIDVVEVGDKAMRARALRARNRKLIRNGAVDAQNTPRRSGQRR